MSVGFLGGNLTNTESGATTDHDNDFPLITIERIQLHFQMVSDFVAAQVANNIIILALSNARILRIDLNRPEDIDEINLPTKPSKERFIRHIFLDPTASHLLICSSLGENYYLHSKSKQPRLLGRLRGVFIQSVAWSPSLPTASTHEILLGASDGQIYEVFIEPSSEFFGRGLKHMRCLLRLSDGAVTGLWVDQFPANADLRRVIVSTQSRLLYFVGRVGPCPDSYGSVYASLFDTQKSDILSSHTITGQRSVLAVSPDPQRDNVNVEKRPSRAFAWLSSQNIFHGRLPVSPLEEAVSSKIINNSKVLLTSQFECPNSTSSYSPVLQTIDDLALTQWHVLVLAGNRIFALSLFADGVTSEHEVLGSNQRPLGFCVDMQQNTFWLFTSREIYEIIVRNEDCNVWRFMMKAKQFEAALQHTCSSRQKAAVAGAYGDHLAKKGHWAEAATIYGRSNRPLEDTALQIFDSDQHDALLKYILTRLSMSEETAIMQRRMLATWTVELYMVKLNTLDDISVSIVETAESSLANSRKLQESVRGEYQSFVDRHKVDLDLQTVYRLVDSHGRESELLYLATSVGDHDYILSFWVQRERWMDALEVLKEHINVDVFCLYSSLMIMHVAREFIDLAMRRADLEPQRLIPALLEYNDNFKETSLLRNQAVRYLNFVVFQLESRDAAIHNTLVSVYASHPSRDESELLLYLRSQDGDSCYDSDFALRLFIQHHRVLSCVHIYSSIGQYMQAIDLALLHNETELASVIADRPMSHVPLRKKLWLAVARKVVASSHEIKAAIAFLKRCELIKIEELIPFLPDFVVIGDFKEEICCALETYSRDIDELKKDMTESSQTSNHIKMDSTVLDRRFAIVEVGEKCYECGFALLSRQFFVFPCQHSFHCDCLGGRVLQQSGTTKSYRIEELRMRLRVGSGPRKRAVIAELDALVASEWSVACSSKSNSCLKLVGMCLC